MDDRRDLIRLMRGMSVELERLGHAFARSHSLHPTDVRALFLVMESGVAGRPLNPGELARSLNLTTAAVSALLDRLAKAEHVRRIPDPGDRRKVILEVGDAAMALGAAFFGPLNARLVAAMDGYTDADKSAIRRFLLAMTAEIADYRENV